jgi:hypothetical protein
VDPLQFLGLVLLSLFVLSLIAGKQSSLLALGALTAFLAVLVGVAYLIYAGFNPVVLAATAVAGLAGWIMLQADGAEEKKKEKKPLFDIRLVEEKCVPMEEGIDRLPEVKKALSGVVRFGYLNKICYRTYEGEDVPGRRAETVFLVFLLTPVEIAVKVMSALERHGIEFSAWNRGLTWEIQVVPPHINTKAAQHIRRSSPPPRRRRRGAGGTAELLTCWTSSPSRCIYLRLSSLSQA